MCQFISWIEKDKDVIFLTYDDIYKSKRGRKLQEFCRSTSDLIGHGAIQWFYNFTGGIEKECPDFSTPDNFPPEIVKALKAGKFAGLGAPKQLLTKIAYAEYEKVEQPALAKYEKVRQTVYAEYLKVEQAAYAKYEKAKQSAWAKYNKVRQAAFWQLFAVKRNRNPKWR